MNPAIYRRLEEIFGRFNEAIVILYSDLLDLFPDNKRLDLLEALKLTLQNTGAVYRAASDALAKSKLDKS